jgi:hypothetical protein
MYCKTSTARQAIALARYSVGNQVLGCLLSFSYFLAGSLVLFPTLAAFAQAPTAAWTARYNGSGNGIDEAVKTVSDVLGNAYVLGTSDRDASAEVNRDIVIIKYNAAGVLQWQDRYNGPDNGDDFATDLVVNAEGSVFVTGASQVPGKDLDMVLLKYNTLGDRQWARHFDEENKADAGNALALDASGNVYVTGYITKTDTAGNNPWHMFFINKDYATWKYNRSGVLQWVSYYGSTGNFYDPDEKGDDVADRIVIESTGNVYVLGLSPGVYSSECRLIKYNASGVQQWIRSLANGVRVYTGGLALGAAGNVTVAGNYIPGAYDLYLDYYAFQVARFNAAGELLWSQVHEDPFDPTQPTYHTYATATGLAVDAAGQVYVSGAQYEPDHGNIDFLTMKYSNSGEELWLKTYDGGHGNDFTSTIALDATGNSYVTGTTNQSISDFNYTTLKYNSTGDRLWAVNYNGPTNGRDAAASLVLGPEGSFYVTGTSNGGTTADDFATIRYVPQSDTECQASGLILREYWAKVKGNQTSQVPVNKAPTSTSYLTSFEAPSNVGEQYASRIRGYLCAPETGNYTFWIASDDYGDLYLSSDEDPANKQLIAYLKGFSNPRQWNKHYSQKSALIYLEKGKRYYIEALHKEAWTNDNLAVAWRLPSAASSSSPVVIPGSVLSPFQLSNARQELAEVSSGEEGEGLQLQAAPNPFTQQTTVIFKAQETGKAVLALYDLQGQQVASVFEGQVQAGEHQQATVQGGRLTNGLYLLRLVNGSQVRHLKLVLSK